MGIFKSIRSKILALPLLLSLSSFALLEPNQVEDALGGKTLFDIGKNPANKESTKNDDHTIDDHTIE